MDIFGRLERLQQRAEKLQRQQSFQVLLHEIENRQLSREERTELLGRLMAGLAAGKIRPAEANKLTKALKE